MSFLKEHAISNPVVAGVSAAAPKEQGLFSTIMDNVAGGAESVIGGGLDYIGAQLKRFDEAGRESSYVDSIRNSDEGTLGKWGDSFINNGEYLNDKAAKNFAESGTLDKYQDMSIIDRLTSADYLTDKRGLLADFSQMAGSAIPFAAASAAAPFGGAGALAARGIGSMAARAGAKRIGKAVMSKAGQQAGSSAAKWALGTGPLEAATNAGDMYADLKDEGLSDDEIARRMNSMIQEELPMDMLTQGIMGPILEGKGFKPIFKRGGRAGKIASYGVNIPGSAASEYAQEMTQQQAQNKWSGKPYGTFFNPTEDEQQAGRAAFMGSLPLGLFGAGHTAYRDYKARINRMNNEAAKSNPNNPFNGMEETAGNKTEIADVPESTVTVQRGNANNGGSDKEAFFNAIEMQESGGDPDAVSSTGARGVYQIQPENWDAWSKEAGLGGASMDDDDAYRQVGRFKMGQYFDEYGPEGALVAWYSGPNNAQRWVEGEATDQNGRPWDAPQGNGPSIAGYVNSAMGHFADEKAQSPALDIPQTADYTISGEVSNPNLTDLTEQKLRLLDRDYYNQYGRHFYITSMARNGGGESWHDSAQAFDTADDFLEGNADARNWLIDKAKEYGLYGLDEYSNPSANATGGHLHFSDHGEALNGSGGSYNITVPGFNLSQYDLTPEQEKANMEAAQALISNNEVTPEQQQSVMEMATQLMNMPVSDDVNEDAAHAAAMQNAIDGGDIGAIFKMHPQETANAMMKTVMAAKAPSPRRAPATPKIDNINPQAPAQTRVSTNYGNRFAQTVDDITKLASQGKIAEAALVARSNGWNNTMVNLLTQGVNASAGNIQNAIMNGIQLDVPNAFPALPEGQGLAGNIKNNQQHISIANLEELASIANNNPQYAAAQATQQNLPTTASAIMQSAMNGQPIDSGLLDSTIQQDLTNNQRQANANRQAIDARMQKAGLATNPATPNAGIIVPNGAPAGTPDIVIPDTPKRKAPTVNTNDLMARLNDSPVFRQAKAKGDIGAMANEADAMGFHKEAEQIRNSQYGNVPSKFDYKKRLSEVKKMSRADRIELGKELLNELEAKNIPVNDNLRNDLEHGVPKAIVNAEKKLANAETNDEAEQKVKPAEEATPAIANNEAAENVPEQDDQEVKAEKSAKEDTVLKGVSGIYESDIKDYIDRGYNIESYRGHLENGKPVYNLDFETSKDKARFVKDFYGESEGIDTDTSEPDYAKELDEGQENKAGAEPAEEGNEKATNENEHRTYSYKEKEEIREGFDQKGSKIIKAYRAKSITYEEAIERFAKLEKEIEDTDDNVFNPDLYPYSRAGVLADSVLLRKHLLERIHEDEQDSNTSAKPSKGNLEQSSSQHFDITDYTHTKTGEVYNAAKINGKVDRDTYANIKDIATKHGGRYNRFAKRFFFKDTGADGRNAFVAEAEREVFGEETKQEEKIAATKNETVPETKVQDSDSEAENTNAEKDSIFGEYNEAELYNTLGIEAVEDNKSEVLSDNVPDGIEGTEEERARLREEIRKELNKISANPIFNPRLYTLSAKYVFSYMKSGLNDIKKLMTTLKAEFGNDFAKDWAPAVIETIRTYPKDIPFNESHVMAVTKSVGSLYENGTTDLDEITSKITAHMNDSAKKRFASVIEASYNGIKKFFDVKKEADSHGLQQGQSGDADGGHRSVATGASQENEHKEVGEVSRPDGRETGRAVTNDDSKDTEKPATGGIRAGSKLEKTGSTGADSGRNKPAVPLTEAQQNPSATETPGHDYEIKERSANKASAPERFKQNIKAIKLLKQLLADNRMPTPAEQKVLAEYNGWGGLKDAFREGTKENNELKELLSESEYKAAKASTLDAFYTAPSIVRAIWKGVSRLGFKGGRVLDPAMGIGNFYGCMPRDMMSKSKLYGVEMDELSSQFSKMLYPSAMVENKPFQSSKAADNFFDLVITNVPFSQAKAGGYMIHNFYFANGIDKVRPGGLMVYITSQGSLTGTTDAAKMRNYLAGRADVIGAYKLPEGAFKEAGTDVSVDVVIVRKRDKDNRQSEHAQSALEVKNFNIGYMAAPVNEYFLAHKNHIIGTKAVIGNDAYGNRVLKVKNESGQDVGKMLEKAMNDLPKDIYQPINRNNRKTYNTVDAMKRARVDDENIRDLEYYVKDGKLYQNDNGEAVPITGKNAPLIKSYVGIKSTLNSLFVAQRDPDVSDGTLDRLRGELNKRYDAFVKKYGYINDPKNVAKFAKDPSAGTIMALEKITFKGQGKKRTIESVEKADIFTERTMQAIKKVISAKNPNDALLASLNQLGHVDIDYMAKLLKTKPSQLEKALKGVIYKNPATETYETSDEYLSGNVREKLAQAEMAAEKDPAYKGNAEALKKVQPADLVTDEIIVNLGAPWIPVADVQAFVDNINSFKAGSLEIGYIPTLAKWTVLGMGRSTKFKADGITLPELLECILNNKSIQVYNGRGKDRVLDSEKTDAANVVADDIKDAFKHWLWQDKDRADRLAKFYNENYNNMVLRKYDGAHLDFPGMNAKIHMKPHQKNVVWRMLQNGNTLIAHCVGAGKTFEMQAAGMEMRRLGLANKPLYCVPNNVVEQFAREFRQLYPNAKLLVVKSGSDLPTVRHPKVTTTEDGRKKVIPIDLKEMTKAERDKLLKARAERNRALARIQTEDWDGIIMSHTMFERLPLSKETLTSYIQEELDMLERTVKQHKGDNLDKRTENALEARKESLENKIDEIMNMDVKDIGIPFEEIGIDQIFVDEADMFKNLHYTTAIGNVSGLTNSNANRSMDMFVKTQYLTRLHDGRGVVFATGTPISNTMAEMYTMMRYLDSRGLKEKGVELFDSWIRTFGEIGTGIERKPSGDGFRKVNKIKNFINMAELTKMFRKFADVKRQEDLNLDIPKLKNDKPTVVALEPDPEIVRYIREVVPERVADMKKNAYKQKKGADNMLKLTGDLRKMALSDAKIEVCADKIADVFDRTADVKGAQLVFCDLGIPKAENEKANADTDSDKLVNDGSEGDNASVYDRLMDALKRRGIPDEQIAFVQQAKNKDEQAELFQKVDRGDLRILIGSTARMGAGTNCQHHLAALHDLDAPWRPRDLEQRHGRILRQGNQNSEVEIFNYVIKDSFDANMWEKLKNKASIIAQAMSDNSNLRVVEDADIATLSYAEIEGAATGNPLIKDQLKLNNEVTKYSHASTEFNRKVHTAETQLQTLPEKVAGAEGTIGRIERDIKARKSTRGDDFAIILDGKTYTKRADADKALAGINAKLDNVPKEIGSIGGFKIKASLYKVDAFSEATPMYQLVKNYSYHTQTSSIAGIENCLAKNPEKELKQLTNERNRLNMLLEEAKEIAAQKNPYTEKLAELNQKLKDINRQIETAMVDKHYSVSEDISTNRLNDALIKQEVRQAFPTGKVIGYQPDQLQLKLQNNTYVTVRIRDNINLPGTEENKARKAHGFDGEVAITVNGYTNILDYNAVIGLARNGDDGTIYHEAFHVAYNMALLDEEKTAIEEAFGDEARKAGKDVEEYAADRYREWFISRHKDEKANYNTIFEKIKGMAKSLAELLERIVNGNSEVSRIFSDIESGKIYDRSIDKSHREIDNEIKQRIAELGNRINDKQDFLEVRERLLEDVNHDVQQLYMAYKRADSAERKRKLYDNLKEAVLNGDKRRKRLTNVYAQHVLEETLRSENRLGEKSRLAESLSELKRGRYRLYNEHGDQLIIPGEYHDTWNAPEIQRIIKDNPLVDSEGNFKEDTANKGKLIVRYSAKDNNESSRSDKDGFSSTQKYSISEMQTETEPAGSLNRIKKSMSELGKIATEKNVEIRKKKERDIDNLNMLDMWVKTVRQVSKKNNAVKYFYNLARKAYDEQEKLRAHYGEAMKRFNQYTKDKKDLDDASQALLQGDMEGKEYKVKDLKEMGLSDNAIRAYKLVRLRLGSAYKLINDARMQVIERNKILHSSQLDDFKKAHFLKDSDILSIINKGNGKILVTYRGAKIYEHTGEMVSPEALSKLKADKDVCVIDFEPVTDDLGTTLWRVDYTERPKPLTKLTGYVPHFFHKFMVYQKYTNEDGEEILVTRGSGRSLKEAAKLANGYAKENPDSEYVIRAQGFEYDEEYNNVVVGDRDFARMTSQIHKNTDMSLNEARKFLRESAGAKIKGRHRFFGNMKKRKGAEGFEKDVPWLLEHYFNASSRYVAMEHWKPQAISTYERWFGDFNAEPKTDIARYIKNHINDMNGVPSRFEKLLNKSLEKTALGQRLSDYYNGRPALALSSNFSSFIAVVKLGLGNFASAAINFMQFVNIGTKLNSYKWAMEGLKRALKPNKLDRRILKNSGVMNEITLADNSGGYSHNRDSGRVRNVLGNIKRAANKTMLPFTMADSLMRKAAILGAYYQGVTEKGMKPEPGKTISKKAMQYAKEVNFDANFDYSNVATPGVMRAGSVLTQQMFQFQKYPIMQLEFMWNNVVHAENNAQRARFLVPYMLLAGAAGALPFGDLLNEFFSFLFGIYTGKDENLADECKAAMMKWAGNDPASKKLVETVIYGIPALAGIDISGRVGMSGAFSGKYYGTAPSSAAGAIANALGGPVLGTAFNTIDQLHNGNPAEAIKAISPALGNMIQAWVNGASYGTHHRVNSVYEDGFAKVIHGLGFRSTDESNTSFINSYLYDMRSRYGDEKKDAMDAYRKDKTAENKRAMQDLGITDKQFKRYESDSNKSAQERAQKEWHTKKKPTAKEAQLLHDAKALKDFVQ
jgi:N12 class adenine-specific DNA methylase